jgi:hypothetical protein
MTDTPDPPPDVVAAAATVQKWLDRQPTGTSVTPAPAPVSAAEKFRLTPRPDNPVRPADFRHPAPVLKPN